MDLVAIAEAAQTAQEIVTNSDVDWKTVAAVAGTIIVGVCSWVWTQTVSWIRKTSETVHKHIEADNEAFSAIKDLINARHLSVLEAISKVNTRRNGN